MFDIRRRATSGFVAIASVLLLAAAPASGQGPVPAPEPHPYGLDPYSPSDAAWLRNFGSALVAQTPLLELTKLDPYKPSHAALIRQLGGAIPLCCPDWYWPGPSFGPLMPMSRRGFEALRGFNTLMASPTVAAPSPDVPAAPAAEPAPSSMATLARPLNNDGVSIRFGGRNFISAGRTVPLQGSIFERIGEYAGSPVYRQTGVNNDLIYVQTRDNLVAPFRLKP